MSALRLLIVFLLLPLITIGQIGSWQEFFSFNNVFSITQNNQNQIIAASSNGYFIVVNQKQIQKVSKIEGLSDISLTQVAYNSVQDKLVVGYKNGNIDIIGQKIVNLPYIKDKPLAINKKINRILNYQSYAFIATGFGILKLDLATDQIIETYFLSETSDYVGVNDIIINGNTFWAATENGLFSISLDENMIDFRKWKQHTFFANKNVLKLTLFNNALVVLFNTGNSLEIAMETSSSSDTWQIIFPNADDVLNIYSDNQKLYLVKSDRVEVYNSNLLKIREISTVNNKSLHPNCVFVSKEGVLYIGDKKLGLIKYTDEPEIIVPEGPLSNYIFHIKLKNGILYAVHGAYDSLSFNAKNFTGEIYIYNQGKWTNYSFPTITDFSAIAIDPTDVNHIFVSSWNKGLYELRSNQIINVYNHIGSVQDPNISILKYGANGVLWLFMMKNKPPIYTYVNGVWSPSYITTPYNYLPRQLILKDGAAYIAYDLRGILMMQYKYSGGNVSYSNVMLFYPTDVNNQKIGRRVISIALDKDNNLWFGTDDGIGIVSNINFEDRSYVSSRITIETQEADTVIINYLLKGSFINSIVIDPAGRKWVGTNSGVYLLNETGTEQILHFTTENSPLPDNKIKQILINPSNGQVFFLTSKGLVSYFSDAAEGAHNFDNAYVYPNPVRENYVGDIVIKGLMDKTRVKITDINGNLIYETVSNGSIARWNGKTFSGRKPATGVYLIFLTNEDATTGKVIKLLIIN